jgi:A/G-specific adenine glycosylase
MVRAKNKSSLNCMYGAGRLRKLYENEGLTQRTIALFQQIIRDYYRDCGREFPWRKTTNPYHILVSEIMLQQTTTSRVLTKYDEFIKTFPDFQTLNKASVPQVLQVWQGLGYNRRALALKKIAQLVLSELKLPRSPEILVKFPGIGSYTAAAISAVAFNQPTVFIDTNIRAVFLFFFFHRQNKVADKEIYPLVAATVDRSNPREWYYALFDYGAMLKKENSLNKQSATYKRQGAFAGSNREIRGKIVRLVLEHSPVYEYEVMQKLNGGQAQIRTNLIQLQQEGFLTIAGDRIYISQSL